jgi:glycolate oxidase FAD binding subunit
MGTLGVIVDVSLKVLPKPAAECTLQWPLAAAEALQRLRQWARQPLPVSASAWSDECLSLRLAGARAAVEEAQRQLGGQRLEGDAAQILWRSLRDQTHAYFAGARPLWRLSLPPAADGLPLDGDQLIEWSGAQRWLRTDAPAADVRACARQLGGHATLFRAGDSGAVVDRGTDSPRDSSAPRSGVFTPLSPALLELQRRVRAQFDPHGVFDAGRLYPEL